MSAVKHLSAETGFALLCLLPACSDVVVPAQTCEDALTRCDDGNPCTFDDCDETTGECLYANADGAECEFQGAPATCSGGVCGGTDEAVAFCQEYEEVCGFGEAGRYDSESDCRIQFDEGSSEKQTCVVEHLGYASVADPDTHCPHAAGQTICDL